jgi:hypothetical protein
MSIPTEDTKREIKIDHNKDPSVYEAELLGHVRGMKFGNDYGRASINLKEKSMNQRKEKANLKKIITKSKAKVLKNNFINKMRLNSTSREPVKDLENTENSMKKNNITDS